VRGASIVEGDNDAAFANHLYVRRHRLAVGLGGRGSPGADHVNGHIYHNVDEHSIRHIASDAADIEEADFL